MTIRIKELLKERGVSQKELAEMLEITPVGLSKILNGNPQIGTLEKISIALGVELWELFIDEESIHHKATGLVCPHCGKSLTIKIE